MTTSDSHEALKRQTVRNRENQRSFRSRRKQYVQELEKKVRAYEIAQVEATRQVQAAARFVASENLALRRLIREGLMVSDEEINERLMRGADTQTEELLPRQEVIRCKKRRVARRKPETCVAPSPPSNTTDIDLGSSAEECLGTPSAAIDSFRQSDAIYASELGQDRMHCDDAAAILTSIRMNASVEDVREELGCGTQDQCKIRHADVFQALNALM